MGLKDPFPVFLGFFECLTVFSRFDPGTPPVPEFGLWLKGRLNLSPACFALDELYTELGSAGAYEAIWRYLDEYRACREVELATAHSVALKPTFYLMDRSGHQILPPLPDKLYVGQFQPSDVYFLGEVYGLETKRSFPFHQTERDARAAAKVKWGVPTSAWPRRTKRST
jgi:hypothetical protein